MILVLSPAKTLNSDPRPFDELSRAVFEKEAFQLVKLLREIDPKQLMEMMNISESLALENRNRYKRFMRNHSVSNSKQAIFSFAGDVYRGLDAGSLDKADIMFAQDHLRILSGMYGCLKPLDLIQAYRLEMGTPLQNPKGSNLYKFWGDKITKALNKGLSNFEDHPVLVNLASNEYFKAVNTKKIKARILNIQFMEFRNGKLSFISFNAKKARGLMARYIIKNQITTPEYIKGFDKESYGYDESLSTEHDWTFIR